MEKTLTGWVNPRYLDYSWNRSFTVTAQPTKQGEIPVRVVFEELAYECAKFDSNEPTYQELKWLNFELKREI